MTEQMIQERQNQETITLGRAFMGFLIATIAICSVWFVSGLMVVLAK